MIIHKKPKPRLGDRKIVKRFALFPMELNATTNVWLQYYWELRELCNNYDGLYYWVKKRRYLQQPPASVLNERTPYYPIGQDK